MDWQQLNESILLKEEYWQERSAAALGELRSPETIELLKNFLTLRSPRWQSPQLPNLIELKQLLRKNTLIKFSES
ncbi:hypothetical protein [Pseudomonas sp. IT-347P]|uniref:hypothetical protein n=1 Tax=Pseudomonas sp. IT-347P TaxID=3026458 RepID=UPI0039E10E8A